MSTQRILVFFVFLFSMNYGVFAQAVSSNLDKKEIELFEFIKTNLDSIHSTHPDLTYLTIEIKIDGYSGVLKEVNYYDRFDTILANKLISWPKLTQKIHDLFFFNPSFEFQELSLLSYTRISVPLNKKELNKTIKRIKKESAINSTESVKPNTNYSLVIDEFEYHPFMNDTISHRVNNFEFSSKLEGLNSEVIKIHENYYLFFKVISTSNNGGYNTKILLSIYYVTEHNSNFLEEYELNNFGFNQFNHSSSGCISKENGELNEFYKLNCSVTFR